MCTGKVTSDERVVKASSSGSRIARKVCSGRSPIALSIIQKMPISMTNPRYIRPMSLPSASTALSPWVANKNPMSARIANGDSAMIHRVNRNIA